VLTSGTSFFPRTVPRFGDVDVASISSHTFTCARTHCVLNSPPIFNHHQPHQTELQSFTFPPLTRKNERTRPTARAANARTPAAARPTTHARTNSYNAKATRHRSREAWNDSSPIYRTAEGTSNAEPPSTTSGATTAANGPATTAAATATANSTWAPKSCCDRSCELLKGAGHEAADGHPG
jgi:hypothetical protein